MPRLYPFSIALLRQESFLTTQRLILRVLDLQATIGKEETLTAAPRQQALIPTGLFFHLSLGFEARIHPRSGLALKHGHHMPQHSRND